MGGPNPPAYAVASGVTALLRLVPLYTFEGPGHTRPAPHHARTSTMNRTEPEIQMSDEAAPAVLVRAMADAAEADDSAEAMDAVFDGVQQSEVGPNSDDLSMGFQDAQVEVDSQESEAEKAAKAEAVAAKTAKVISGLTPDRVRQLNDLMHALDMNCNTSVRKVVDGMRSLAMNSEQLWMMLESFDVERAAMREGFGKVTEKGLSAQRVVFKYEKEYRASESANRLEELKETNGTLVVLAKEMENPTDDAVQAEWDKLPEHEREARTLAAEYGVGLPRIHTLMQQARDAEATKRKPQPDVAVLIARCRKELEENGRKTFDDRIAIARKSESSYTNAIKHLEERFPQRGEYLKATRDIRDILSGTVAPRPDPAPPPAVSYDDCVKSMNQAQAVADEAAIERDLLQPGSEQYFMDLHKFNRLRAEVAVMQEPVYMPPVDATVELTGEEAKAAADAAHAESVHWKESVEATTIRRDAAERAMRRLYLSNEANRANLDAVSVAYRNAIHKSKFFHNQGLSSARDAAAAEHEVKSFLSDQWKQAHAKWQRCNSDVTFWREKAEALKPKPKPKPKTVKQRLGESRERVLARAFAYAGRWEPAPYANTAACQRHRARVEMMDGPPAHVRYVQDENGRTVPIPTSEYRVTIDTPEVDARVHAHNERLEARKMDREKMAQQREQLQARAKHVIHESNEKKAIADRIREAEVQAKKQWFVENKNTLLAFEEQTRDIIGALSKKAVNTFPCLHRKRKNKPEKTMAEPAGGGGMVVHGHPVKRSKTI